MPASVTIMLSTALPITFAIPVACLTVLDGADNAIVGGKSYPDPVLTIDILFTSPCAFTVVVALAPLP